ncbi:hypothetical protein T484DRAFT_1858691 [Baffinella frigidus]|nr:hypothetical protein T484DRAFT_1858691 [Cryptophyta sp. CCMP2293]
MSNQLSVQNGAQTHRGYLSTLEFTGAFWDFAAECKAATSVAQFVRLFEAWAGDTIHDAAKHIGMCGRDDFSGWWNKGGLRFVTPTLSQQANQLASLIARQGPAHPLSVQKLSYMLSVKWAQKNTHHWPSRDSFLQTAIFDCNFDLFEMLGQTLARKDLTAEGPTGMQHSLLEYAAGNGNGAMFERVYQHDLTKPSVFYAPLVLRRCLKIVLERSTVETDHAEEQAEVFDLVLDHCDLNRLPPTVIFSLGKTCIRFGCTGVNCNPLALRLIEAGADAECVPERIRFCPEQKSLIHTAMVDRAVAFRIAFAMGLHPRLGASSLIRRLDPGLVKAIVMAAGIGKSMDPYPANRYFPRAPPLGWGGVAIDEEEQATTDLPV